MDARRLELEARTFDGAFLCWVLEHLAEPERVLAEVRRVLQPGAPIVCTEVLNATLFVHPPSPHLAAYWAAYNAHQAALDGDPYVGAKLGNLLSTAGFGEIATQALPYFLDRRQPGARADMCAYFEDLLLSAAPGLVESGRVTPAIVEAMRQELVAAGSAEDGVFFYVIVRAFARS
jgi:hypothetical protein